MALRVVFCGTPAFALPSLQRLVAVPDFKIEAVITQPDRPRGRGQRSGSSPVKEYALETGLHVYQPEKIKSESAFEFFERLAPDVVVIIAYGQIIPARLLDIPRLGWINLHASLLPRYRGAAPIQRAILAGETRTGLTTMLIDAGLDTGPILMRRETDISPDETAPELARRMALEGAPLLAETLRKLDRGEIAPVPQGHTGATLAPPLRKEEGRIEWPRLAQQIYNQIRGLEPWPGAFTTFRHHLCQVRGCPAQAPPEITSREPGSIAMAGGELFVACGEKTFLRLETLQLEGRKWVSAREFANGARLSPDDRFGS